MRLALADDRILFWSNDKTLRVWDAQHGHCLAVFKGHSDSVLAALALTDGQSAVEYDTLLAAGRGKRPPTPWLVLEGHSHCVAALRWPMAESFGPVRYSAGRLDAQVGQ